jgi:DNA polymerase
MAAKCKTLPDLKAAIESFDAGAFSDGARGAVVARGNPDADIMIIGEAPGAAEDAAGQPFIGPAGQLLDKIFASIGLTEETLYITNVVNWRAPNNRKPNEAELAISLPIIRRHIALKKPKLIVLVGGASMTTLTGLKGITKTRGTWETLDIEGAAIPALITYHPAYLLLQPHLKRDVWRDMLSLSARIEAGSAAS